MADASIYSMIRPAQQGPGPMEQYGKALTLKTLMGQQSLQELQEQQARKAIADEDATSAAYREAGGDPVKVRDILYGRGLYKPAMAAEKSALEIKEKTANIGRTEAETGKARAETLLKHSTYLRDRLAGVNDQAGYEAWIQDGARLFGPEVVRNTPPQFSPQVKQQLLMKADDLIVPLAKQLEIATTRRGQDLSAETARRGQDVSAATAREGHRVTMRGQDLTNARALEANDPARIAQRSEATARGKEFGETQAQAQIMLPTVVSRAERAISLIDDMVGSEDGKKRPHPGFSKAVGTALPLIDGLTATPGQRFIPGTDAADFQARFDELKGGQFLEAFESLKGGGAITQVEGQKATQAISRMSLAQSEREYIAAAREFQGIVRRGIERAKQKAGQRPAEAVNPASMTDAEIKRELGIGG